ncbi:diguanylate cyclase [Vibrio sp. CAIM 722]|uniref:diguanylate cyclase n=1 Tax=Vibrio eleionomae TaxID=2653505 RepID=A0A7X4LQC8_9VIBR|nr:diguanylate cyclase [Vibrio eleionomae]
MGLGLTVSSPFEDWFFKSRILQVRYTMMCTAILYIIYCFIEETMELPDGLFRCLLHGVIVPIGLFIITALTFFPNAYPVMRVMLFTAPITTITANLYFNLHTESFAYLAPEIYLNVLWVFVMSGLSLTLATFSILICFLITIFITLSESYMPSIDMALHYLWMASAAVFGIITYTLLRHSSHQIYLNQCHLEEKASSDTMTNVWSHDSLARFFDEMRLSDTQNIAIMMVDIDHFKRLNDRLGHVVGHYVLVEFAALLKENCRGYDYVGRYGGETFCILLPKTPLNQARLIAESLRAIIADHKFSQSISLTASIGVAMVEPNHDFDTIVELTDQALFKAKHDGRNSVVMVNEDHQYQLI